ncbi:hypothetical protein GUITHDRAFT_165757 [Guillardia theta CCMP2712]|uniref:CS domain-containing protein n=2 Tax=Guillardia theta TaxID=55529 RepID=L1IJY2_GUITC|nr:hypothetical protein GUITHDRAFT_165757 [Guillardia theta CCMP2712]EKX36412.1 hypothetical protein GUITHDRAFT_165757 [Guillardia theta CCMP2712]|eukprot:XP_005823392.1 hypothetical protein GUITHDRAFT_165757 [Guillardia theta CCMP2712]
MAEQEFEKGNEHYVKENWDEALKHFSRAAELDPSKAEYLVHKAAALCKKGLFDQAVEACDRGIEVEPQNSKSYLRKGMTLVSKGDLEAAKRVLLQGQGVDPSNRSFATWLKKCDASSSDQSGMVEVNSEIGKHDTTLTRMLEQHNNQAYAMLDTTIEFVARKTTLSGMDPSTTSSLLNELCRKYWREGDRVSREEGTRGGHASAEAMRALPVIVSSSAKVALENARKLREQELAAGEGGAGGIKPGTQCKNNGCTNVYENESSLEQKCRYHPGAPVFHEGYKYWSCCKKKKTTEFSEFLSFAGCTEGTCVFQDDPTKKKKALCRYDFFQQGGNVTLSIYAKKVDPDSCSFNLSPTRLTLSILFDVVNNFSLDVELFGRVDPDACKVSILAPKVEITLKKADGTNWTELGNLLSCGDDEDE